MTGVASLCLAPVVLRQGGIREVEGDYNMRETQHGPVCHTQHRDTNSWADS